MTVVEAIKRWLDASDPARRRRCLVAFSGGMDSQVLLHAFATLPPPAPALAALHLDHALQAPSADWAARCRAVCRRLGVEFLTHRLDGLDGAGGTEAAARAARYRWFAQVMKPSNVIVTAHHLDDQAETLLYNLCRGAGPRGLSAMPRERPFAAGYLARPLIELPREVLAEYARHHALEWVEDPSNLDTGYDRNYLRRRVMPAIVKRWPNAARSFRRAAVNIAESVAILDRVAAAQVGDAAVDGAFNPLSDAPVLDAAMLAALPVDEFCNLARFWIEQGDWRPPPRRRLLYLREHLVCTDAGAGTFAFDGVEIRRYRRMLYLVPGVPRETPPPSRWRFDRALAVPGTGLVLDAVAVTGRGLSRSRIAGREAMVDFATSGRELRPVDGGPRKSLRKLFQERGVPPFIRRVLPRIMIDGELAAVAHLAIDCRYRAAPGEAGLEPVLSRAPGVTSNVAD